jgi:predicted transcriptional regulator
MTERVSAMTKDVLLSVRIPSGLNAKLERLAKASRRSKSAAVTAILSDHVDSEAAYVAAVEEGLAAARRGDLFDHEEVVRRIEQRIRARTKRRTKAA